MNKKRSIPDASVLPDPFRSAKRLDLNLLHVFDMVMMERHVTRAAERLDMTQSAVSNALNRLRRQFHDQLFVKVSRGVDPTPRALALWPKIHQAIEELYDTVAPQGFDALHMELLFRISLVDLPAALISPYLYESVHSKAPDTTLLFVPHDPAETGPRLMRGELDFAINIETPRASVIQAMPLWSDPFVVAARKGHPILSSKLTLATFCEAPQLEINLSGTSEGFMNPVDIALSHRGLKRSVRLSVNQFSVAPAIIQRSDLIAVLPARLAMMPYAQGEISIVPLPFTVPDAVAYLSWHQRSNSLPAHQWMKQRLLEAATKLNVEAEKAVPKF